MLYNIFLNYILNFLMQRVSLVFSLSKTIYNRIIMSDLENTQRLMKTYQLMTDIAQRDSSSVRTWKMMAALVIR